jgi:hypothetical protein
MNTIQAAPPDRRPLTTDWSRPEIRAALTARDVKQIYRRLQRTGFSQVVSYAMLGRIVMLPVLRSPAGGGFGEFLGCCGG